MSGANLLQRVVKRLLPGHLERLERLSELEAKYRKAAYMKRMFGQTNFGLTGDHYEMVMRFLAIEFNQRRYWWMKPLGA